MTTARQLFEAPPNVDELFNKLAPELTALIQQAQAAAYARYKAAYHVVYDYTPELEALTKAVAEHPLLSQYIDFVGDEDDYSTSGFFNPRTKRIIVKAGVKSPLAQVLKTLKHELVHHAQDALSGGKSKYTKKFRRLRSTSPENKEQSAQAAQAYYDEPLETQANAVADTVGMEQDKNWRDSVRRGDLPDGNAAYSPAKVEKWRKGVTDPNHPVFNKVASARGRKRYWKDVYKTLERNESLPLALVNYLLGP